MEKTKYLIIGNGIAGLSAAREIRNHDKAGDITIVSSEPYLTYYRPRLSEGIYKDFNIENILVYDESWYRERNIKTILRVIVEKIDLANRLAYLDDARIIEYEKLLIATGSRPFIPPIKGKYKEGVFALRTFKGLNDFKKYLRSCNTVTVIGGGLLGLEAAWSLKLLGKKVNVIEFAPYLLPRQLDKELANELEKQLDSQGINTYTNSQVEEILGDERANGVKLNGDRELPTDAILISSGVRPNLDLIRDTGIEFDKGIKVDVHMRTNMENVYAAGDVVEIEGMILGLWTAGNEQGKIAGANMVGVEMVYNQPKIITKLEMGDIKVFSAGIINNYDTIYEYQDSSKGVHHKIFVKEGLIYGAILFGDLKDMVKINKAVTLRLPVEELIKDLNIKVTSKALNNEI